jgi:hypothetical protein
VDDRLVGRMENLERSMESLRGLPARVDRLEARDAILEVMDLAFDSVTGESNVRFASVHLHSDQTRTEMRVLHEDLVERIARLGRNFSISKAAAPPGCTPCR